MGFLDMMKAANGMNLGDVESPDFPCGKIVIQSGVPVIINGAMGSGFDDYPIKQSNIKIFKLIGCGGTWAKYLIVFNDGKSAYITQDVSRPTSGSGAHMASIERYIKYVDVQPTIQQSTTVSQQAKQVEQVKSEPRLQPQPAIAPKEQPVEEKLSKEIVEEEQPNDVLDIEEQSINEEQEIEESPEYEFSEESLETMRKALNDLFKNRPIMEIVNDLYSSGRDELIALGSIIEAGDSLNAKITDAQRFIRKYQNNC